MKIEAKFWIKPIHDYDTKSHTGYYERLDENEIKEAIMSFAKQKFDLESEGRYIKDMEFEIS